MMTTAPSSASAASALSTTASARSAGSSLSTLPIMIRSAGGKLAFATSSARVVSVSTRSAANLRHAALAIRSASRS